MNKKLIALAACVMTVVVAVAGPHGCPGGWGGHHPGPPPPHHGGGWGHGGRQNFWAGFAGAAVGALVGNIATARTTAYAQPVYAQTGYAQAGYVQAGYGYAQPVAAQQVAYAQPTVYGTAGVNTNPYYTSTPIIAPNGGYVTAEQPIIGGTRVWVNDTYIPQEQGNGTIMMQHIPGHCEY